MQESAIALVQGELYLIDGGVSVYEGEGRFIQQKHFELAAVLSGSGKLDMDHAMYPVEQGDIFVLMDGASVRVRGDGLRCVRVVFDGVEAVSYLEYMGFTAQTPIQPSNIPCEIYLSMVQDMLAMPGASIADSMLQTGFLYRLFSVLVETQRVEGRGGVARYDYPQEVYVETLKEYISRQYSVIRISDLAKYLGVNRSYLTVIFKKATGMSPQQYLMQFRMEKAAEMLLHSTITLREIADRVGYADPFTFSKTFKAYYGIPPSQYRKQRLAD